jgi:hypothetical protein
VFGIEPSPPFGTLSQIDISVEIPYMRQLTGFIAQLQASFYEYLYLA